MRLGQPGGRLMGRPRSGRGSTPPGDADGPGHRKSGKDRGRGALDKASLGGSLPRVSRMAESPGRRSGPVALGEALGHLFASRGLARRRAASELEAAWEAAVGPAAACQTRLGGVRHGVLTVTVAHPTLLEELSAFRKPALLASLRKGAPGTAVQDLRFRVGPVD